MPTYQIGSLTLKGVNPIINDKNPFLIPVDKSSIQINSCGKHHTISFKNPVASEYVLFVMIHGHTVSPSFYTFKRCLASNCRLYDTPTVTVLLLKVATSYGCLQVSMVAPTTRLYLIQDVLGHPVLTRLDALYEYMRTGGDIENGFGFLTDFNGAEYRPAPLVTDEDRRYVYHHFIKQFITDIDRASNLYEQFLELSLATKRKKKVRTYISQLVTYGISQTKNYVCQ